VTTEEDTVYTIGYGARGQLGNATNNNATSFQLVRTNDGVIPTFLQNIRKVVLGGYYVNNGAINQAHLTLYAINNDGKVFSWGRGGAGELGSINTAAVTEGVERTQNFALQITDAVLDSASTTKTANYFRDNVTVVDIVTTCIMNGSTFVTSALALDSSGEIWTWGSNFSGVLGHNGESSRSYPTRVTFHKYNATSNPFGFKKVTKIFGSGSQPCFYIIDEDGIAWGSGSNTNGNIGIQNSTNQDMFNRVLLPERCIDIFTTGEVGSTGGGNKAYFKGVSGKLYTCGSNEGGALGVVNLAPSLSATNFYPEVISLNYD